jgi:transposase InsO family protein
MRYPAAEKLEIIRLVEGSHLPVRQTLAKLGIPTATFYRWYERFQTDGPEALEDLPSRPDRVWNRISDAVRGRILDLALAEPELSPRELAVRFTERDGYFVSEASVYRLLKAHDLITSPAFIVVKAADEFHTKTTAPNQLWQTDFTYLKVTGWGWFYLSTVLDDFSRYVIAWKLCTGMAASDVTDTLELALAASGCTQARVRHRPRLLSDNGPSYISGDVADWLASNGIEQPDTGRRLLRPRPDHPARARTHQAQDHPPAALASPKPSRITCNPDEPDPPLATTPNRLKAFDGGHLSMRPGPPPTWPAPWPGAPGRAATCCHPARPLADHHLRRRPAQHRHGRADGAGRADQRLALPRLRPAGAGTRAPPWRCRRGGQPW